MPAHERREQLLDAALDIIVRDGYGAVSVEAIAREVDVTRPVVYNVFDGLDALLQALLDRQEKRALDQLLTTLSKTPRGRSERAYFGRTVTGLVEMVTGDPRTWTPILAGGADTPAVVRGRIERDRELVRTTMKSLIEPVLAGRRGSDEIDSDVVSHTLIAIGEYYGRMLLEDPDSVDAAALSRTLGALFVGPATRRP